MVSMVLLAFDFVLIQWNLDVFGLLYSVLNMNIWIQLLLACVIALVSMMLSYFGSLKVYSKRYSK